MFQPDHVPREIVTRNPVCLHCTTPMRSGGRKRLHEGRRAWPVLSGDLGELFVNREEFDVYARPGRGEVELFMQPAAVGE